MSDIIDYDDEPNILFFKGVLPEKYNIDTIFTNKIMESLLTTDDMCSYNLKTDIVNLTPFDKMPLEFSSIDVWPRHLNIQCWWCNRKSKSMPIFIPKCADVNGKITTLGMYDTFFCAAAYIDVFIDPKERWEKHELLKLLYKRINGVCVKYIPRAPSPHQMICYGYGSETSDMYAKKLSNLALSMVTYETSPTFSSTYALTQPTIMDKHI